MESNPSLRERYRGLILGTAVGDALGLPAEGLSRQRARKWFGGLWRHRLLLGRGMVSDDTQHALMAVQCLLAHPDSPERFTERLGWCLRLWLLTLPAGIGWATLRAIVRLWVGFGPLRSGVRSAGNGPAMRSAPIGAFHATRPEEMDQYLERSTRITHTDEKALVGAKAVAYLAAWAVRDELVSRPAPGDFVGMLRVAARDDPEWQGIVDGIERAIQEDWTVEIYADSLGLANGVSGYIYHTVPVAAYAWYRHFGDFAGTLTAVLSCGGDTDTLGAIAGALAGSVVGEQGIPVDWVGGILEWPVGVTVMRRMADRLCETVGAPDGARPVRYFWPGLVLRGLAGILIVLGHGVRRLLPPW